MVVLGDMAFHMTLRLALALVFAIGVAHKANHMGSFASTVKQYRLLPDSVAPPAALGILAAECVVIVLLVWDPRLAGLTAAGLLLLYSIAISVNLIRGRRDIDCGCSGPAMRQTLSGWLVIRNVLLALMALGLLMTTEDRALGIVDWFSSLSAVGAFGLLYYGADRLADTGRRLSH